MNRWKYRSMKIACAFVMALSILPGATSLLACEEDEQPVEPPVVEEPEEPVVEEPEEPVGELPVEPPVGEIPKGEEPSFEDNTEINDNIDVDNDVNNDINNENINDVDNENDNSNSNFNDNKSESNNENNNNINFNPNINIDIDNRQQQQQQQKQKQQQKQEQKLRKDNPVAYLRMKSKQVNTRKQTLVVGNRSTSNTKKAYVKGKDYINGKGPIDENYVEGKGPIDEDYVENPETGEADVLIACGAGITGASALLVIIRKVLIKI